MYETDAFTTNDDVNGKIIMLNKEKKTNGFRTKNICGTILGRIYGR